MRKLTTTYLLRLTALAAVVTAVLTQWPRSLPPYPDGSTTWYRGFIGKPMYNLITGTDMFGCAYRVKIRELPGYSLMTSRYPDGTKREESEVFVSLHPGGCEISRLDVRNGQYFAPDGVLIAEVINGTGTVKYHRPDGSPARECTLVNGKEILRRIWSKTGQLRVDTTYHDAKSRTCYYDQHGKLIERSELFEFQLDFFQIDGW